MRLNLNIENQTASHHGAWCTYTLLREGANLTFVMIFTLLQVLLPPRYPRDP